MAYMGYQSHRAADNKEWREARKLFKATKKLPPTAKLFSVTVRLADEALELFWRSKRKQGTIYGEPKKPTPVDIVSTRQPLYLDDLKEFIAWKETQ